MPSADIGRAIEPHPTEAAARAGADQLPRRVARALRLPARAPAALPHSGMSGGRRLTPAN